MCPPAEMYNIDSSPILTNVTFTGNEGDYGGGLYNRRGDPVLTGVTFSNNSAGIDGGGINNTGSGDQLSVAGGRRGKTGGI